MIGTFDCLVIDCPDPGSLARFYEALLGLERLEDLDVGEEAVTALGASLLDGSDKPIGYRVYADPVGHPSCLVTPQAHDLTPPSPGSEAPDRDA